MKNLLDYLTLDYLNENKAAIILAVSLGIISLGALRKYVFNGESSRIRKYPVEIDFTDGQLGSNLAEFLTNLDNDPERYILLLQKLYPNECTLKLNAHKRVIFLNSIDSVRKLSAKVKTGTEPIANRPKNPILQALSKNYLGSFFRMFDSRLLEIRKSSLVGLHTLMANAHEFECIITDELQEFMDFLATKCLDGNSESGCLTSAPVHLQQLTTNLIVKIGLDVRFDYDLDPNTPVKGQIGHISDLLSVINMVSMSNVDTLAAFNSHQPRLNSIYEFLNGALTGYKSTYEKDRIQTFADFVLSKRSEKLDKEKFIAVGDNYSDEDILVQFFTLFMAGAVTTGFTVSWAFYYLAKNPQVQTRLYEELVRTVGTTSLITTKHRAELKYTEACLNEILRLASTQSFIPRATGHKVNTAEYSLDEDVPVLINMFAIHRDANYWSNAPNDFDPERWLDQHGNVISHPNASYIPFGVSPRLCLGDNLSKVILFLTVANLVQRYEFKLNNDNHQNMKSKIGVMRRAPNYDLKITARK